MEDCVYHNETPKMVVLKCVGRSNFYLEKVVMPAEWFWFEAPREARVEIWQMAVNGQLLSVRGDVCDYLATSQSPQRDPMVA
ncbi:MAG: DUF1830 domain-containing protein [Synechococcus sp.]